MYKFINFHLFIEYVFYFVLLNDIRRENKIEYEIDPKQASF